MTYKLINEIDNNWKRIMNHNMPDAFTPPDNCSICDSDYDPDRGGIQGYFGIMPVTFCEWCYSSIMSMAEKENRS
jgi:hypothetical protein|tara:strand:+ start:1047 stop:1271 length:225 start_codon:yes stop_codon:yes gene_type:complete